MKDEILALTTSVTGLRDQVAALNNAADKIPASPATVAFNNSLSVVNVALDKVIQDSLNIVHAASVAEHRREVERHPTPPQPVAGSRAADIETAALAGSKT